MILVYDTETTGLPDWSQPSDAPQQPHLVEIAALLFDDDGSEVEHFTALVKPDGWAWGADNEAFKVHRITAARAEAEGIPEAKALAGLLALHARAALRVAHNESFDARMIRIAIKRYGDGMAGYELISADQRNVLADSFKAAPKYCTMNAAKPIMRLPATEAMVAAGKGHLFKAPSLQEAHQHFIGRGFEGAHGALADARACARVYFAMGAKAREHRSQREAAA